MRLFLSRESLVINRKIMSRIITTIIFLAAAVAFFWLWTMPLFNDISALDAEKASLDNALAKSKELQTLRDNLLSQYNAISQDDLGRIDKLLPQQLESGDLITTIENRAKFHNLLLKNINISKVPQSGDSGEAFGALSLPYKSMPLSFVVSGRYDSFSSFLTELEKNLRLIDVEALSFSAGGGESHEFSINTKTYTALPSSAPNYNQNDATKVILALLADLQAIKIDSSFFQNEVFKSLTDFSPGLEIPKEYGQRNPFSPLE